MNIQIITSSYPAYPQDPSGAAGLFVQSFALELRQRGHHVVVQPVGRKRDYVSENGIVVRPLPWRGGDRELASLNFLSPHNWFVFFRFFIEARKSALETHRAHQIDRTLCMWAIPSGVLGYWIRQATGMPYDVWALGSDIWKIRKIPFFGSWILKKIIARADRVFADGIGLSEEVSAISGRECAFLPSSRLLPSSANIGARCDQANRIRFLFVGRYHRNKGPDLLLEAVHQLPQQVKERIRVSMYGVGPLKGELEQQIRRDGLDHLVELNNGIEAEALVRELSQTDYLVIPSRVESIPVVFSDALQCGVPVITMPVGDLTRLVHEHRCGFVAESCTSEAFSSVLKEAALISPFKFSLNAKKLSAEFAPSRSVEEWLARPAIQTASGWDDRSRHFQDSPRGVLFQHLPDVLNRHIHEWHRWVIRSALAAKQPERVLDIGCGYGRLSLDLLEAIPGLTTLGVDISSEYVRLYEQRTGQPGCLGSIEGLPDEIGTADCVLLVTVLMYVSSDDAGPALRRLWGHLQPGGKLIIIEPDLSGRFFQDPFGLKAFFFKQSGGGTGGRSFSRGEMAAMLRRLGPSSIRVVCMPVTTWLIIVLFGLAKVLPTMVMQSILNGVACLDRVLGRLPLSTLHRAYIVTKA